MQSFITLIKQFFSDRWKQGGQTLKKASPTALKPHLEFIDLRLPSKLLKWAGGILLLLLCLTLYGFVKDSQTKFLPNTIIAEQTVGGLTAEESLQLLANKQLTPPEHLIELVATDEKIASTSAELEASFQTDRAVEELLTNQQAKLGNWLYQLLFTQPTHQYELPIVYNPHKLAEIIGFLKQSVDSEPHLPAVSLTASGVAGSLVVDRGSDVFSLDEEATLAKLLAVLDETTANQIKQLEERPLSVSAITTTLSQQLTDEQTEQATKRAADLVGERIALGEQETRRVLSDTSLVTLLKLPEGYREDLLEEILIEWETELNRPPSNAEFEYNPDTLQVTKFVPHRDGLTLNKEQTAQNILGGLYELEHTDTENLAKGILEKELVLQETPPEITLADTNDLGITERIGFGESWYYHSIPNRVHNVSLTTSRISLAIVPPGHEFSFNQTLGDVSSATGFRPAYVIKDGHTLLGDGGGVCQVSTTLFRALLDSGLNITRRLQHSYRVSYYELDRQPGFDATVYAGNVDLRFINDTDHHVLVYGQANPNTLYMTIELYGTSDGRTTEITNHQTWDSRPPLPPQYTPDPSLAPGQLVQVDWAASGIKAQFTHIVRDKDGQAISEETYYSNYRPWAAKFLQGV